MEEEELDIINAKGNAPGPTGRLLFIP